MFGQPTGRHEAPEVLDFHLRDDLDQGPDAHHHTLGLGANQALNSTMAKKIADTATAGVLAAANAFATAAANAAQAAAIAASATALYNYKFALIGSIKMWGVNSPPVGHLICDGASVATATYPDLFAIIGYTYGGAGANFNLPDLRGRVPVGKNAATFLTMGSAVGSETQALASTDMPLHTHAMNHNHTIPDHQHPNAPFLHSNALGTGSPATEDSVAHGAAFGRFNSQPSASSTGLLTGASTNATATTNTGNAGGVTAPNNIQPSRVLVFVIRVDAS